MTKLTIPVYKECDNIRQFASNIAKVAHLGQVDKGGNPYFDHVWRVGMRLCDDTGRVVGFLHDLLEDTDWIEEDLRRTNLPTEVIDAVVCMTRGFESYEDYIDRVSKNPIARGVKIMDLSDNMDMTRIKASLTDKDIQRLQKYHKAYLFLINTKS